MVWVESWMCTGWLQGLMKNLCMFKAPLAKSELLNTAIYLLVVIVIFLLFRSDSDVYTVHTYLLFKCFVNAYTQTPLFRWTSFPTLLVSPTRHHTTPSPSPAPPLPLREWFHQRHSLGEGGLGHQCVTWMTPLTMVTPSSSTPPTWTSPPAPVIWE